MTRVSDNEFVRMCDKGHERFMETWKGLRVDRRSYSGGYYAACALLAHEQGRPESISDALLEKANGAIHRSEE